VLPSPSCSASRCRPGGTPRLSSWFCFCFGFRPLCRILNLHVLRSYAFEFCTSPANASSVASRERWYHPTQWHLAPGSDRQPDVLTLSSDSQPVRQMSDLADLPISAGNGTNNSSEIQTTALNDANGATSPTTVRSSIQASPPAEQPKKKRKVNHGE
jgi:hypothetical protein